MPEDQRFLFNFILHNWWIYWQRISKIWLGNGPALSKGRRLCRLDARRTNNISHHHGISKRRIHAHEPSIAPKMVKKTNEMWPFLRSVSQDSLSLVPHREAVETIAVDRSNFVKILGFDRRQSLLKITAGDFSCTLFSFKLLNGIDVDEYYV